MIISQKSEGICYIHMYFKISMVLLLNNVVDTVSYLSQKLFTIYFSQSFPTVNAKNGKD